MPLPQSGRDTIVCFPCLFSMVEQIEHRAFKLIMKANMFFIAQILPVLSLISDELRQRNSSLIPFSSLHYQLNLMKNLILCFTSTDQTSIIKWTNHFLITIPKYANLYERVCVFAYVIIYNTNRLFIGNNGLLMTCESNPSTYIHCICMGNSMHWSDIVLSKVRKAQWLGGC